MTHYDTILTCDAAVFPDGVRAAEIGLSGGRIAAIGDRLSREEGTPLLDTSGLLVLPGVIDAHVHLELPVAGTVSADDWRTGPRAGARAGVTTLIDFAAPEEGESLEEAAEKRLRAAEGKPVIDYSLHVCITDWRRQKEEVPGLIRRGFPTFKEFMIYEERGLRSDRRAMEETLLALRGRGAMLLVHAESSAVIERETARRGGAEALLSMGAGAHRLTRPPESESEAVREATELCAGTEAPLYIVHLSTGAGAAVVAGARRRGAPLFAETCPQYLTLEESLFDRPEGHLYATCPRIGAREDREALWRALREGVLDTVATDTCSFTPEQKARWRGDWRKIPMGLPGLETLLPLVYTFGVKNGRIGLERMADLLSGAPARLMGLAPRKGAIAVGADADLVLLDPEETRRVRAAEMEGGAGWSPYEGWELAGWPRTVLSRGEVVVENGRVTGGEGRGLFLPRSGAGGRTP